MRHLLAALAAVSVVAGSLVVVSLGAQSAPAAPAGAPAGWTVPRTADGRPDLQGVWGNNSVTPMTRPRQWKDKASLSDAEVEELKQMAARFVDQGGDAIFGNFVQQMLDARDKGSFAQVSYDPTTGNYNQFWMADREWDNRTSLVIDPPDGQFPPFTPEAEARREAARTAVKTRGPADGPEDRPLSERCISYGAPRTGANYNSYVQIIQSPQTTVLLQEMIHDARVVPMDGATAPARARSASSTATRADAGTATRWWSRPPTTSTGSRDRRRTWSSPSATPASPPTSSTGRVTVNDPKTWTKPYTFMIKLKKTDALIYEYACHEGNYAMEGILAGARREEARGAATPAR